MKKTTTVNEQLALFENAMKARRLADSTRRSYKAVVREFLRHFRTNPKDITSAQITEWLARYTSGATIAQKRGTLYNYYKYVVGQYKKFDMVPKPKQDKKLPVILSQETIQLRLNRITNLKHKAIISILYGAGLRRAELLNLKPEDIDKFRTTIHVHRGKGAKDRIVPISENVLTLLRAYYRQYKPRVWLFEGRKRQQYSPQSVLKICKQYMRVSPHNLRHCHATHLIEAGVDVSDVSKRLGHAKLETTMVYNHISTTFNPITLLSAA